MSERGLTDNRMRYVLIILHAAVPLVAAYDHRISLVNRPEGPLAR